MNIIAIEATNERTKIKMKFLLVIAGIVLLGAVTAQKGDSESLSSPTIIQHTVSAITNLGSSAYSAAPAVLQQMVATLISLYTQLLAALQSLYAQLTGSSTLTNQV